MEKRLNVYKLNPKGSQSLREEFAEEVSKWGYCAFEPGDKREEQFLARAEGLLRRSITMMGWGLLLH